MTSAKSSCFVCGDALSEDFAAWCGQCGRPYHLNPRNDTPGKDCGQVWINDEFMTLEFACNTCLNPPSASLDDILDAAEAALAAGMSEEALIAAADAGSVPHRRTSAGVYLFARRDLP